VKCVWWVVATILNFVVIFDQTKMLYVSEANLAFIFSTGKYIHTYLFAALLLYAAAHFSWRSMAPAP